MPANKAEGLRWHPDKTLIAAQSVPYLGFLVGPRGMAPQEAKIATITALKPPTNVKEVRSYAGFFGYYRSFILNYSTVMKPLTKLLAKDQPWH